MMQIRNFDLIIKRVAWICLSLAGISVVCLVGYIYSASNSYKSRKEIDRIQFRVELDSAIRSTSKAKIFLNNADRYFEVSKDSASGLIIKTQVENGFRPVGKIESTIYTINGSVIELRIDYKEGFNSSTLYSVVPSAINCDSLCKEYSYAYKELASLNDKAWRLSKVLSVLSPKGIIDTVQFSNAK